MTHANSDTELIALMQFAFDTHAASARSANIIPPSSLHLGNDGRVQFVTPWDRHTVVGITAANWIMIVGVGWRQVHGLTSGNRRAIATACNAMQSQLIEDRGGVLAAMAEYWSGQVARGETAICESAEIHDLIAHRDGLLK